MFLVNKYSYKDIKFIQINNNDFEVVLSDIGASIYSIKLNDKYMNRVTQNEEDFVGPKMYDGKTIGRVANRIQGNVINIEGKSYILDANENGNTLHGGVDGLSNKRFSYEIEQSDKAIKVIFLYTSSDGESGFPGNLNVKVTYSLVLDEYELRIDYLATSDKTTPCSLTNHAYFTLGERNLNNTKFQINASRYLYCDPKDLTPIEIKEVISYLDFKKTRNIMDDVDNPIMLNSKAKGYDHHFYFDDNNPNTKKAELITPSFKMSVFTNFLGMQIYSANEIDSTPFKDVDHIIRNSIAIEPQDGFETLHLLKSNEIYSRFIRYVFEKI